MVPLLLSSSFECGPEVVGVAGFGVARAAMRSAADCRPAPLARSGNQVGRRA